ncbi:MAG: hypothetical protein AAF789_01045 [Bacteroidota bacterium]
MNSSKYPRLGIVLNRGKSELSNTLAIFVRNKNSINLGNCLLSTMKIFVTSLVCYLAVFCAVGQSPTECKFIGEISLISVESGAFLACSKSGNSAACTIAVAAHNCGQNPACDGLVKELVENGCKYTVEVIGPKLRITGKSAVDGLEELKQTFNSLNTVEGVTWIENVFTGY